MAEPPPKLLDERKTALLKLGWLDCEATVLAHDSAVDVDKVREQLELLVKRGCPAAVARRIVF